MTVGKVRGLTIGGALSCLVGLLAVLLGLRVSDYTSVETPTVLCYARTLAAGGGLALQEGAIQTVGVASPLWTALLALVAAAGLPLMDWAKFLGLALAGLAVALLPRVSARLNGRRTIQLTDLLPALLLAVNPALARHAVGGLETSLGLLLLCVGLNLFVDEERRFCCNSVEKGRRTRLRELGSAVPLLLLPLVRPESVVLLGGLWLARLLARSTGTRISGAALVWLLLPPLFCVGLLLAGYALFAELLPGTATARDAFGFTRLGASLTLQRGWEVAASLWHGWGGTLPLLVVALVGAGRPLNYWARMGLVAAAVGSLVALVVVGGDPAERIALFLAMPFFVLLFEGLTACIRRLWPAASSPVLRRLGGLALSLGLCASLLTTAGQSLHTVPASPLKTQMSLLAEIQSVAAELGWRSEQIRLLTTAPGAAAWVGFSVVDASGVTDPAIRRYHGNRRPLELHRLIFRERRPDVLLEQGHWRAAHNFSSYPETGRAYIGYRSSRWPEARFRFARRLVLEPNPQVQLARRVQLDNRLIVIGARVQSGRLVLLWTVKDRAKLPRSLTVALGTAWQTNLSVGPSLYPVTRWRPGEIVRQVIPLPSSIRGVQMLSLVMNGRRVKLGEINTDLSGMTENEWFHETLRARLSAKDHDGGELVPLLLGGPRFLLKPVADRLLSQARHLMDRGLLLRAAEPLQAVRPGHGHRAEVRALFALLGQRAYARARQEMRQSRGPTAFALLRAAGRVDSDAWIARRLEEARRRMPAGSHLVQELELEMARRTLALSPTAENLARVMAALLELGRPREALATAVSWNGLDELCRLSRGAAAAAGESCGPEANHRLVAWHTVEARDRLGQLEQAAFELEELLARPPAALLSRRCPDDPFPRMLVMRERLARLANVKAKPLDFPRYFSDPAPRLGRRSRVISHCARWSPGRPLTVELVVDKHPQEELGLRLMVGSHSKPMPMDPGTSRYRRLTRRFDLPPASYPTVLRQAGDRGGDRDPLDLGTVVVGPEATFGFELPSFVSWRQQGKAFGGGPVVGRSYRRRHLFGYLGEQFADSYAGGSDRHRGTLLSPRFRLRRDFLMVLVSGGDSSRLGLDLLVAGRKVRTVRGRRTEVMRPEFIPIWKHRGRWARIRIRDRATKRWGHIAVDGIRQLDGPAPAVAP